MTETYTGEAELKRLNDEWQKAMSDGDHELADKIQKRMDDLSERAIKLADLKLKASLRRYGMM